MSDEANEKQIHIEHKSDDEHPHHTEHHRSGGAHHTEEHKEESKAEEHHAEQRPADQPSDESPVYTLPQTLIGRADLARLVREIEVVDNELESQKVHGDDNAAAHLPAMSRTLTDFVELNKLNIADAQIRAGLRQQLKSMKDKAPSMHMVFAVDADPEFLHQLITWIRTEIHPQALLDISLQPSLVGGVYLRTPNHVHDFSLKTMLQGHRDLLIHELEAMGG